MSTQKLITLCFATVFTLGLAACGGGGDAPVSSMMNGNGGPPGRPPAPGPACATSATSQACVDDKKMVMDEAKKALEAAKADENSTQKQIADAQKAYDDAKMAHMTAMEGRATYLAMQAPMYDMKAMAKAIMTPGDTDPVVIDGGMPPVGDKAYAKATWPVGDVAGFAEAVYEDASAGTAIVTYTDKQAAKGAKFSVYYATPASGEAATEASPAHPLGYMYAAWKGVDEISDAGVFTLETDVTGAPISVPHGAGSDSTKTFVDDDDTDANELMMKGSFHGMSGTYECTDPCSVVTNAKGELITLNGVWTFTPTKGAADILVDDVLTDANYLDFGYWVTTADDPTSYSVGTFANGVGNTSQDVISALVGLRTEAMSATYKGGAAGLYAKREYSGTGDGDLLGAGRFTATAELKAYFGTGDHTAVANQNKISGMISNFRDGGSPIDATWRVKLGAIDFSTSNNGAFGGDTDLWSGQFIGGSGTTAADVTAPTGVAGEFTHEFDNGEVIGAFGATR